MRNRRHPAHPADARKNPISAHSACGINRITHARARMWWVFRARALQASSAGRIKADKLIGIQASASRKGRLILVSFRNAPAANLLYRAMRYIRIYIRASRRAGSRSDFRKIDRRSHAARARNASPPSIYIAARARKLYPSIYLSIGRCVGGGWMKTRNAETYYLGYADARVAEFIIGRRRRAARV